MSERKTNHKPLPPSGILNEYFSYNESTGIVCYKKYRSYHTVIGKAAGRKKDTGYYRLHFLGVDYYTHRIIWCMVTGEDPGDMEVDHINGDVSDNRWTNLRLATHFENLFNSRRRSDNTSGIKGVAWDKDTRKWRIYIYYRGKPQALGRFKSKEEAEAEVRRVRELSHQDFHNHGT